MSARKSLIGCGLAVMAALMLAACGGSSVSGSGGVSTLDPANAAAADSLLYVNIAVRPQGSQAKQITRTINELAGKNVVARLPSAIDKLLRSGKGPHTTYAQLKPWLGENLGIDLIKPASGSLTGSPDNELVFIMPTNDPSTAGNWAKTALEHQGSGPRAVYKVDGNYLLLGGKSAVPAAAATLKSGDSLASSGSYRSDLTSLASDSVVKAYANAHALLSTFGSQLSETDGEQRQLFKQLIHEFGAGATVALGLELKPHEIRLDLTHSGQVKTPRVPAANVGSLPATSWLAVDDNGFSSRAKVHQIESEFGQLLGTIARLQQLSGTGAVSLDTGYGQILTQTPVLELVYRYLLPALGPLSLSLSGNSSLDLKLGLDLNSLNKRAQSRLMAELYSYARRYLGSDVTGSASGFDAPIGPGLGARVVRRHGRLVATYGYDSTASFLHPSRTLAANPTYRQALSELPSGTRDVPLYLNFGGVSALAGADHNSESASTKRIMRLLKFMIVGSAGNDSRIVIGLN